MVCRMMFYKVVGSGLVMNNITNGVNLGVDLTYVNFLLTIKNKI